MTSYRASEDKEWYGKRSNVKKREDISGENWLRETAIGKSRRATQRGPWAEDADEREYQRHYPLIKYITQNLSRPVN